MAKQLPGPRTLFEYHCWESDRSSDAHLWHRTRQRVTVLHKIVNGVDEADVGRMYRVRFDDGLVDDVFADELPSFRQARFDLSVT